MRPLLLLFLGAVAGMAAWAALAIVAARDGWGRSALAPAGDADAFARAVRGRLSAHEGNGAYRLIVAGELFDEYYVSRGEPVNSETLFQVGSLSKWVTAWGIMSLVNAGRLDLDAPVDSYLTRWHLPQSRHDNNDVTIRRLLSHTAGLTDGLGYNGFPPGVEPQSLEESLTRAADASAGTDGCVRVGERPGKNWRYSGGGYTLLQLVIEESMGEAFESYMRRAVLEPLGMSRSTFRVPVDMPNVADFFDQNSDEALHYRFTALGAASLYTTAADMTRFLQAHLPGPRGEPVGRGVLTPATVAMMRAPHASKWYIEVWGLGVSLYVPNGEGDFIIGHEGFNAPAVNSSARLDPTTGDGIILFETGSPSLATSLGGEWVFWQTGRVDIVALNESFGRIIAVTLAGWAVIAVLAAAIG